MSVQWFSVPKYPEVNEDKWHISEPGDAPIVLCDGASESFNSNLWAELLANGLDRHEDFTSSWLVDRIAEYDRHINPANLSWAKQLAYERGSFSTFLSVQLRGDKCLVNAVGDTVVFIIADNQAVKTFPYDACDCFLEHPVLLSTKRGVNPEFEDSTGDSIYSASLPLAGASHVLMATDALAHWLMKRRDADDVEAFRSLLNVDEYGFRKFVEMERKNDLRLDDTTMIRIDLRNLLPISYNQELSAVPEK